jgi:hypothetical protein
VTPGTNGCRVEVGTLADPYTGTLIRYVRDGDTVDIDHVVALSNAWQTGASGWDVHKRAAFANEPPNLLAVASNSNRQKGGRRHRNLATPEQLLPLLLPRPAGVGRASTSCGSPQPNGTRWPGPSPAARTSR